MKLQDKIVKLRKANGMSQEDLAERINVSRQAISRWEGGSAQADATNILQLSKVFGVTSDYLLNDDYESDYDLPKVREVKKDNLHQIMIFMITIQVMTLILQFITTLVLQNEFFALLSFLPFVATIGVFEYEYQKKKDNQDERTRDFRKKFYKISVWLGAYFPIRFIVGNLAYFYPRSYNSMSLEAVIFAVYLMTAMLMTRKIEKNHC